MTRRFGAWTLTFVSLTAATLTGCSGNEAPAEAPVVDAPKADWVAGVKPWYCGTEALPALVGKDGTSTPQSRDVALKIMPGTGSLTALFAAKSGNDKIVGSMTRFVATADHAATLHWENDQKQKGEAALVFAPDYGTVTVTWTPSATPPGTSPVPAGPATLTAGAGSSACVTGGMIR
ncbi:MAG: hypothetical protein Q8P41_06720 [Pseudomonadota bacterium]|nr:hypothetical protein [Pseudomonadota bacterium]